MSRSVVALLVVALLPACAATGGGSWSYIRAPILYDDSRSLYGPGWGSRGWGYSAVRTTGSQGGPGLPSAVSGTGLPAASLSSTVSLVFVAVTCA